MNILVKWIYFNGDTSEYGITINGKVIGFPYYCNDINDYIEDVESCEAGSFMPKLEELENYEESFCIRML